MLLHYMRNDKQPSAAAEAFARKWEGKGYEKGESQVFWTELLTEVYGIEDPSTYLSFEQQAMLDHTSFIDVLIPSTHVMIEQKSIDKDINKPIRQSDGTLLTPFQQAQRYSAVLPYSQRPRWIVICNFREFAVHDMENPNGEPYIILLKDLGKEYYRLQFLVEQGNEHLQREMEVSMKAGEIVGKLYDALIKQYIDPTKPSTMRSLNILCVRLVFCLYAEDAGIFGRHGMFHDYLAQFDTDSIREQLIRLFHVLNTKPEDRDPYMRPDLAAFPYVNGGLFAQEIEIPRFTEEICTLLLQNASTDFDWSQISPTIFGAVFESTLNPETRRTGGMHYTSIENIHKVIDPLFLDDLHQEFEAIMKDPILKTRRKKLQVFQDKLSSLTFLDPACGSGNFLTETYLSLRRIENKVIRELQGGQMLMGEFVNPIKVSISQFYGIELNDFAVTVATTALWISEAQTMAETEQIIHQDIDFLPLKAYANIREGNALQLDWDIMEIPADLPTIQARNTYVIFDDTPMMVNEPTINLDEVNLITKGIERGPKPPKRIRVRFDFIIGNPPFIGYSQQTQEQKEDLLCVFKDKNGKPFKAAGKIDYVAGWYYKAAQLMRDSNTRTAFVSTNSITQGEQVALIWKPLKELFGIHIDFAYKTFLWDSEATQKAHVHCVIIGFSSSRCHHEPPVIFEGEKIIEARHINGYLVDADDVYIESRNKPVCPVPLMTTGNRPADGGHLIIEAADHDEFVRMQPDAVPYIKKLVGSAEFINGKDRYCLWLKDVSPTIIRKMKWVVKRIEQCRDDRLASPDKGRQKLADTPHLFRETLNPENYIIVPSTSSERRRYIPMGFLNADTIPTNAVLIIPDATLYHFGVLESNVHMAWMRAVCGRLKSDYRYSKDIVYNNFPWPSPTTEQKTRIAQTAQAILDARAQHAGSSLADLYDPLLMPYHLLQAHRENDRAVMEAYGFDVRHFKESYCVAELFRLYQAQINTSSTRP